MTNKNINKEGLYNALKHGDEEHQKWLKEAIDAYYEGKEIPYVQGGSAKDARIKELEKEVEELNQWIDELNERIAF